jgi:proteasome lid subunit RPN8/RPN11
MGRTVNVEGGKPRAASHEPGLAEGEAVPILTGETMAEIIRYAESGYPEEICGMVIGCPGAPDTYSVRPVPNIANREPQDDPAGRLRDARTAYKMDPLEQLHVLREVDAREWQVLAFYHSHPDHAAYFSAMDRERALMADGEPIWPGARYLVVSVIGGRAHGTAYYRWDAARRDFCGHPVDLPVARS